MGESNRICTKVNGRVQEMYEQRAKVLPLVYSRECITAR